MGTAVLLISLAAAFAGAAVGRALRKRTGLILRIGGVIMVLAGLWVILYGLAELLPRYGVRALDEVLFQSSSFQGADLGRDHRLGNARAGDRAHRGGGFRRGRLCGGTAGRQGVALTA